MNVEHTTSFSAEDPADETARATSERLGPSATAANREYGDWGETFATAERQHFSQVASTAQALWLLRPHAPPQGAPS